MSPPSTWPRNRLLLALPARNLKQLLPEIEHIRCQREQVLLDADSSLDSIFFLDSGVVSVMAVYSDGGTIEMATIGREGCTGVQAAFGAKNSSAKSRELTQPAVLLVTLDQLNSVRSIHMR